MKTKAIDKTQIFLQNFSVSFHYKVCFTRSVFSVENRLLADTICETSAQDGEQSKSGAAKCVIIIDKGVTSSRPDILAQIESYGQFYQDRIQFATKLVIPGGEDCKNQPERLNEILSLLNDFKVDRHSYLIAIGGGALLDLAGLAAALFHRGVRLIRIPTTVLAQNDAGVGVKNGINNFGVKNLIGTFAPPFAVINDFELLSTLDPRDRIAGMAEALKVALIRDSDFYYWLEDNAGLLHDFDETSVSHMIRRCAELHMQHIAQSGDPFEKGNTRPLDFGHWAAHYLESLTSYELRHGEAVSIGMAIDNRYAVLTDKLNEKTEQRIQGTIRQLGLPLTHNLLNTMRPESLLQGLEQFREHLGGQQSVTLLNAIGQSCEVNNIDKSVMSLAISQVGKLG